MFCTELQYSRRRRGDLFWETAIFSRRKLEEGGGGGALFTKVLIARKLKLMPAQARRRKIIKIYGEMTLVTEAVFKR